MTNSTAPTHGETGAPSLSRGRTSASGGAFAALADTVAIVVFATILCDDEHAFWLDAGPGATTGFSWLGVGAPGAGPRDLPLVADAQQAAAVPGPC